MASPAVDAGVKAQAALGRALAQQPERDGAVFTEATEQLCRMRDLLIGDCRAGRNAELHLSRLNAVISSALTGHFPLGKTNWALVKSGESALKILLDELREQST